MERHNKQHNNQRGRYRSKNNTRSFHPSSSTSSSSSSSSSTTRDRKRRNANHLQSHNNSNNNQNRSSWKKPKLHHNTTNNNNQNQNQWMIEQQNNVEMENRVKELSEKFKTNELRAMCAKYELKVSGTKPQLSRRLYEHEKIMNASAADLLMHQGGCQTHKIDSFPMVINEKTNREQFQLLQRYFVGEYTSGCQYDNEEGDDAIVAVNTDDGDATENVSAYVCYYLKLSDGSSQNEVVSHIDWSESHNLDTILQAADEDTFNKEEDEKREDEEQETSKATQKSSTASNDTDDYLPVPTFLITMEDRRGETPSDTSLQGTWSLIAAKDCPIDEQSSSLPTSFNYSQFRVRLKFDYRYAGNEICEIEFSRFTKYCLETKLSISEFGTNDAIALYGKPCFGEDYEYEQVMKEQHDYLSIYQKMKRELSGTENMEDAKREALDEYSPDSPYYRGQFLYQRQQYYYAALYFVAIASVWIDWYYQSQYEHDILNHDYSYQQQPRQLDLNKEDEVDPTFSQVLQVLLNCLHHTISSSSSTTNNVEQNWKVISDPITQWQLPSDLQQQANELLNSIAFMQQHTIQNSNDI